MSTKGQLQNYVTRIKEKKNVFFWCILQNRLLCAKYVRLFSFKQLPVPTTMSHKKNEVKKIKVKENTFLRYESRLIFGYCSFSGGGDY